MTLTRVSHWQDYIYAILVGVSVGALCIVSPIIALAIIVGGAFIITALKKPIVLCYVVITATIFLSGMQRGQLVNLFIPNEPILIGAVALAFLVVVARTRRIIYPPGLLLALLVLELGTVVVPLLAYYARGFSLGTSDVFSLIAPAQYILLAWLFSQIPQNDTERHHILQWMLFCASCVALIGLLQAMHFGPVINILNTWYPSDHLADASQAGRVTSVLGAWNTLGNYLMIALILVFAMQTYKRSLLSNLNMLLALGLCGACLLASGSYASLGGLVFGVFMIRGVFDRRGLKILAVFVIALGLATFLLQDQIGTRLNYQFGSGSAVPQTLSYRFMVWQQIYLPIIDKHLLWGVNPTFEAVTWQWAESEYLYLLFRSGLFSLLAHLAFVALVLRWAFHRIRSDSGLNKMLAVALFTIVCALSIMGFTNEVFTSSGSIDYLWILIGLIAGSQLKVVPNVSLRGAK